MPTVAPQPLIEDIESGRCLPFIGAGFSLNAKISDGQKMPDWQALTDNLASTIGMPTSPDGPAVAAEFERRFGRVQLIEAIRRRLLNDIAEPGEAHLALAPLPFDTIYTTNFDLLIEDALFRLRRPFRSLVGELQMPFHGGSSTVNVVKMHGDLRHEEHIIVAKSDYSSYLRKYPIIATHLSAQLITRTALFIGYSLTDPDFLNIRKIIKSRLGRHERMAFVVSFDASQDDIDARLNDNLHVINLNSNDGPSRDDVLAEFLKDIQTRIDIRKGITLRKGRPDIFENITEIQLGEALVSSNGSPVLTGSSNLCFVSMPIGPEWDILYFDLIQPVAKSLGLLLMRAENIHTLGSVAEEVRVAIQQSRIYIADISHRNPNIMYELGIAQTAGKPLVLLSNNLSDSPFDLTKQRHVRYSLGELEFIRENLSSAMRAALGEDRLVEARQLIDSGHLEAAAVTLGIALEQTLRKIINSLNITSQEKSARPIMGMMQLLNLSVSHELVSQHEKDQLIPLIDIRNQVVHARNIKLNTAELRRFFKILEVFINKHR